MSKLLAALVGSAALAACGGQALAAAVTYSAAGANPAAIQASVDAFRTALGPLNPNTAGSAAGGRREINWDGVPDASAAPNNLAANFFNVNSPRGVVLSTPGTGFQVSANLVAVAPVEFGNINPTYPSTFGVFSPQRLFTALGSNITDVNFFVPGSSTPATVSGFGAVFTDVDLASTTSIQLFNAASTSLGTFAVTAASGSETLSFLGVSFNAGERVVLVRITSGNTALAASVNDSPTSDVVVMDDFIYGEPIDASVAVTVRSLSASRSGRGVVVRWRTASEVDLLGFNLYREQNGRRVRVNKRLISAGNANVGRLYSFVDRKAPAARRLGYWLQAVSQNGSRSWLAHASTRGPAGPPSRARS